MQQKYKICALAELGGKGDPLEIIHLINPLKKDIEIDYAGTRIRRWELDL